LRTLKPLPVIETSPPGKAAPGFTLSILGVPFIRKAVLTFISSF